MSTQTFTVEGLLLIFTILILGTLLPTTQSLDCYSNTDGSGFYGDDEFNKTTTCPLGVNKCAVRRHFRTGNGSSYESLCLDDTGYNRLKFCGKRLSDRTHRSTLANEIETMVEHMDFCCCNGTLCNNKEFAKACINGVGNLGGSTCAVMMAVFVTIAFFTVHCILA